MACTSQDQIARMIRSDQRFMRFCWYIYALTFVISGGAGIYLHHRLGNFTRAPMTGMLPVFVGAVISTCAVPSMFKHLQRIGAVSILEGLQQDCQKYGLDNPAPDLLADTVYKLMLPRGGT